MRLLFLSSFTLRRFLRLQRSLTLAVVQVEGRTTGTYSRYVLSSITSIQLFQLTLSDESFKSTNQNRKVIWDFYACLNSPKSTIGRLGNHDNNTKDLFYFKLLFSFSNLFSLFNVTELFRSLICRDGFQVQIEKRKLSVVCSCSPQNL